MQCLLNIIASFTEQAGPRVPLPHDPLGIFSLFFDDRLVGMIVEGTNRYAELSLRETNKQWLTDADEIRVYMYMGFNYDPCDKSPTRDTRLLVHRPIAIRYDPIADRISRDRFEEITRYLHFVDIVRRYQLVERKVFHTSKELTP